MIACERHRLRCIYLNINHINEYIHRYLIQDSVGPSRVLADFVPFPANVVTQKFVYNSYNSYAAELNIPQTISVPRSPRRIQPSGIGAFRYAPHCFYHTRSGNRLSRWVRKRRNSKSNSKPVLNEVQFQRAVSELAPRVEPEEVFNVLSLQKDPLVCLAVFNWASQQPRFRHDVSTYHITIKKLGAAKLYKEMDEVVNLVLAIRDFGSEALYNTMIYYFTEARKLTRAVNLYKHMKKCNNGKCRPSIRTYNLLFTAFLSKSRNSYINYMYMGTMRSLFKQLVDDGIEPDIYSLNAMIKGYVISLHVNDALRIFHQMGVVYAALPNTYSYDYLIHGLCAQGRTHNATELCIQMKEKGFLPSWKAYNSLVNALALGGEVDRAVDILWDMIGNRRLVDFITYQTVLDEHCRRGRAEEALMLLKELQEKGLVDRHTNEKLLHVFEDDYGDLIAKSKIM